VRENSRNTIVKYNGRSNSLIVLKREGSRILPDNLYLKLGDETESTKAVKLNSRKIILKIRDTFYNVNISSILYLLAFIRF
jgi:hypothetical protein